MKGAFVLTLKYFRDSHRLSAPRCTRVQGIQRTFLLTHSAFAFKCEVTISLSYVSYEKSPRPPIPTLTPTPALKLF